MVSNVMQGVEERSSTTPMVSFSFGELEAALARLNQIGDAKRVAFQGRLKHFLKLGLLPGVKQGRGKAATYSAVDAFTLSLAVELAQFGLWPERVVDSLVRRKLLVAMCLLTALKTSGDCDDGLLTFDPRALDSLTDEPIGVFIVGLDGVSSQSRRLARINISTLLQEFAQAMGHSRGAALLGGLTEWVRTDPDVDEWKQFVAGSAVQESAITARPL